MQSFCLVIGRMLYKTKEKKKPNKQQKTSRNLNALRIIKKAEYFYTLLVYFQDDNLNGELCSHLCPYFRK